MTGPLANVSEELTGGGGPFIGEATPANLQAAGYVKHEFVATGTATSYRAQGELTGDGEWEFATADEARYRTRILVRRPADRTRFSGTVVVEWLNVSGGVDGSPDHSSLVAELTRRGHAWTGVSAQVIGVEGGQVIVGAPGGNGIAGKGLKRIDPVRYGSLEHPGDAFSFDIYTQVARALRQGGAILGGRQAEVVLAVGESQSALALVTYYNGVQPLTRAFDGFLVHSRGAVSLPLVGPGQSADLAGSLGGTPVLLRTDLDAPVLTLQTEGDITSLLDSVSARQPDTRTLRLWEVAGTSHADAFLLGATADGLNCGCAVNNAPMHVVAKGALRALDQWVRSGVAPPEAQRIQTTNSAKPEIRRDSDGIALGGVRTPPVDVPVDVLSSVPGPTPDMLCLLAGSTRPLPQQRLAQLYASREDYMRKYAAATDDAIGTGFVVEEDRDTLLRYARPEAIIV